MKLFFDTETTGVPKNYRAPAADTRNWPRMVQLAWLLTDGAGKALHQGEFIIKPDGFTIPAEAAKIHGITTERALAEGVELSQAVEAILADLGRATELIAHNVEFDEKILGAELIRLGLPNHVETKLRRCTMRSATDFCAIPGPYGFKWPKLQELHQKLFRESFDGAHDALVDVKACARCYFELVRLGILN
ncbi:MAG: 3'-5' exonuclease [Elusimicrobia bacterium]|nr:3'-5' exonuclease [Elusimicrobiota bacterium]